MVQGSGSVNTGSSNGRISFGGLASGMDTTSMAGPLVRRSRSSETAWMIARAARFPAGVTTAPPSGTGA